MTESKIEIQKTLVIHHRHMTKEDHKHIKSGVSFMSEYDDRKVMIYIAHHPDEVLTASHNRLSVDLKRAMLMAHVYGCDWLQLDENGQFCDTLNLNIWNWG